MQQLFGNFIDDLSVQREYLLISFSPGSMPLKQHWRKNGLSADFLADYVANFLPMDSREESWAGRKTEIKGAVGYIANELLENAMKYSAGDTGHPISIALHLYSDKLIFVANNSLRPGPVLDKLRQTIEVLLDGKPEDLYLQQLEHNAASSDSNQSGMGFLTMLHDYSASLGWKFETSPREPEVFLVTTMVRVPL